MIVAHGLKRQAEPGHWVPIRPIPGSLLATRSARSHCSRWGHCHHPANSLYPVAYCCHCGRARHLIDRWMGR